MAHTLLEPDEMQIDGRLPARAQFLCLVLLLIDRSYKSSSEHKTIGLKKYFDG